ncbi:MAG: Holliday junction resolvase RuvX [Aquificaceae bacterium]|uniref:Holliday junction resolvase RuvX n=1 Tax=Hydrogenobacter sp. Uz 6-8 TaxID=3384828 RepID=UPI0030A725D8
MKVLAIDYGSKRIGLALGDTGLGIALPLESIENKGEKTLQSIVSKVKEHGVYLILVGLPLTPLGKEGQRAGEAREFSEKLKSLLPAGVEVILWDERYTTKEAYRMMEGFRPEKKKKIKDSLSAYVILLEYMESL